MMTLRPYQAKAVEAVYAHLRAKDDNPCIVIPTAGGKTPVMATICRDAVGKWGGRVLILAHVKELLLQTVARLADVAPETWRQVGIYSAGLKARDTEHPIIVAGIQSVFRRAAELGPFDLIIVDEAHMIPPSGDGMYRMFLADAKVVNPHVRLIGLTATPFRMSSGEICGKNNLLNSICYEVGVRELIVEGYLCPLRSKAGKDKVDVSGIHTRGGEFIAGELADLMDNAELVQAACAEIAEQTKGRRATLIFASGVKHAQHVQAELEALGLTCGFVYGETPAGDRADTLKAFKLGKLPYLVNVNVLTTGFDAPIMDCVAMLRPTMSPGLYYQMVGRGFRLCDGKADCLVLDFGGNIIRHGPVDAIVIGTRNSNGGKGPAPAKECPECAELIAAGYSVCPACGYEFPPAEENLTHGDKASTAGILSGQEPTEEGCDVEDTIYGVHVKSNAPPDHPVTMRVEYSVGFQKWISEWLCFDHKGWARKRAEAWWRARSDVPLPASVEEAVALAKEGALAPTTAILVRRIRGEKYDSIAGYQLGEKPTWRTPGADEDLDGEVDTDPPGDPDWAKDLDLPF